jgi:hypothetical protein
MFLVGLLSSHMARRRDAATESGDDDTTAGEHREVASSAEPTPQLINGHTPVPSAKESALRSRWL